MLQSPDELRNAIKARVESERRLQAMYERRAAKERRIGHILPDLAEAWKNSAVAASYDSNGEERAACAEMLRLEEERSGRAEAERAYRQMLLESFWNLRKTGVPEQEIKARIDRLRSNAARTKQLDAAVAPAREALMRTESVYTAINRISREIITFGGKYAIDDAQKPIDALEKAIDIFHEAYGEQCIVQNLRHRVNSVRWTQSDGYRKAFLRGTGMLLIRTLAEAVLGIGSIIWHGSRRKRRNDTRDRVTAARMELISIRAQLYRVLKRIAWEREYLLEQLLYLENPAKIE